MVRTHVAGYSRAEELREHGLHTFYPTGPKGTFKGAVPEVAQSAVRPNPTPAGELLFEKVSATRFSVGDFRVLW
ncbi:MAG: hypothetical protein M1606_00885 [Candidatus Thermoplasmatota archaeon]|nr:hypothetical protein [Candidatus Thermoplasmatota archaeon]